MRRISAAAFVGALALTAGAATLTTAATAGAAAGATAALAPASIAVTGLGQHGTWVVDASGRDVVLHGLNQVYKVAPYEPATDGFGADDAAFLASNGFNAVRVGVIWEAVEPQPGVYDNTYLASIASTVNTLAAHGIVSLLDFHQDLYSEAFQGEGAPAWAVQTGGLPNPPLGFPGNYFANPAEWHAWDAFWANSPASDGVGLQDHYARTWAHVAKYFAGNHAVAGYEVLNEPWPGTLGDACLAPQVGCPSFDGGALSAFYGKVDAAIRAVDHTHTVYLEPDVLFSESSTSALQLPEDAHTAFAFHDYCGPEALLSTNVLCPQQDGLVQAGAANYSSSHSVPRLLTEFGATNDLSNLSEVVGLADQYQEGWLEWAYTGNDKTSSSSSGQALVYDPSQPPTGANVNTAKLAVLAEPYPQEIAGTPGAWSFTNGTFTLTYTTARVTGGAFAAGAETDVAVPVIEFPHGYRVSVTGARVVSAPGATTLRVQQVAGATRVTVSVTAQ
jgi:endoglycosylceramidase